MDLQRWDNDLAANNFNNYLIELTDGIIPMEFIKMDTYESTPNQMLDKDPKRDSTGVLHRTVLEHTASIIKFTTMPLSGLQHDYLMDLLHRNMTDVNAHQITLKYWNDNWHEYRTGVFYMVDPTFKIVWVDPDNFERKYAPTEFEFIEY